MAKTIPLVGKYGHGQHALVDDDDYDLLVRYRWFVQPEGYVVTWVSEPKNINPRYGRNIPMHHMVLPEIPQGMHRDHINGVKTDNRRSNLRICSPADNQHNSRLHKGSRSSVFRGVYRHKRNDRWCAQITIHGTQYYLGSFKTERDAATVYDASARFHFGPHANVNFPEGAIIPVCPPNELRPNLD